MRFSTPFWKAVFAAVMLFFSAIEVGLAASGDEAQVLRQGALVYVMQGDTGSYGNAAVFLDGKYIDKLTARTHLVLAVSPGSHEISTAGTTRVGATLTAKTGNRYYLWQVITASGYPQITVLSEMQGQQMLAASRPAQPRPVGADSLLAANDEEESRSDSAAGTHKRARSEHSGVYFGVSLGQVTLKDLDAAVAQATADLQAEADLLFGPGAATAIGKSEDSSPAVKLFAGYRFNKYLALEGMFAHLGQFEAKLSATDGVDTISESESWKVNGFGGAVVGDLPIGSRFALSARLGLIAAFTQWDWSSTDTMLGFTDKLSDSAWDVSPFYGVGARFNFSRSFAIRAEYERYSKVGDAKRTGEFDLDMITAGVVFTF